MVRLIPFLATWRNRCRRSDLPTAIVCLLPAAIIFGAFNIFPILYSGYLSLLEWDGLSATREYVGLENYAELLSSRDLWNSLGVTYSGIPTYPLREVESLWLFSPE